MIKPPTINMDEFEDDNSKKNLLSELDPELCPVCQNKTLLESLEAEGLVLTGVKAILDQDAPTIVDVMKVSDQYTAHTAISLYAKSLYDISEIIGADWRVILETFREQVETSLYHASRDEE
jgi:hypothetical protein